MSEEQKTYKTIKVDGYGDMLEKVLDMKLVSFEHFGKYQGDYLAVLREAPRVWPPNAVGRLFYYIGEFGSCPVCDWLESELEGKDGNEINYATAVEYATQMRPTYIVPEFMPLTVRPGDRFTGFPLQAVDEREDSPKAKGHVMAMLFVVEQRASKRLERQRKGWAVEPSFEATEFWAVLTGCGFDSIASLRHDFEHYGIALTKDGNGYLELMEARGELNA